MSSVGHGIVKAARWLAGASGSAAGAGIERFAAIQVQTSAWGAAIPIVYGTNRLAGNLIYTKDFLQIPNPGNQGVGKGGGTVQPQSYTYSTTAILALCEGPIVGINNVWADDATGTLSLYGWNLFTGSISQAAWGFLTTNHPTDAVPYSGTAYVAAAPLQLGGTNTLKNFSFEVQGFNIIGGGNQDAHPADIIPDFLSNARYGAGWDSSRIGNLAIGQDGTVDSSFRQYCTAAGFFLSPVIAAQRSGADHLKELLEATNSDAVFTEGLLKIFPYGDQAVTGNGVTFTPATTPIYDLTADDFLVSNPGDDPVAVERIALSDTFNTVPVEFSDRGNDYNRQVVQDVEPNDADNYGQRTAPTLSLPCITRQDIALQISGIKAQRSIYVRNNYKFRLGWSKILLDPMDLVTLTDVNLGLVRKVVRIKTITESESGDLDFVAEEWPFGVASPTLYSTQTGDGETPNTAVDPGDVTVPYIFDIPFLWNQDGDSRLGVAVAGGQWWGGCEVWVSADGVTYALAGLMQGKSRYGVTSSALAAGSGFDTTHSVDVDLTLSGATLVSTTDTAAQALTALSILDGEYLSFATATLFLPNEYTLTRIQRGGFGTAGGAHLSGSNFARLDDSIFYYTVPTQYLGATLHFKFVSINIFGGGKQDIAGVVDYTYTPSTTIGIDPPYPASVSLAITTTQPALPAPSASNPLRHLTLEQSLGGQVTASLQAMRKISYVTVSWTAVSITPASLLTKYRAVLYKGTDPNDESARVAPLMDVDPGALSCIFPLAAYDSSLTLSAAVQAWYGSDPSSWRTSSGTVVHAPGTTPLTPPLVFELTQLSSDRSSVTFSIVLHDPLNLYGSITIDIQWGGLTSVIDNGTGSPVGATKTVTVGTGYSFTANLNAQFRGAGYVKFHAAASGRADGYGTWLAAETDQDAAPSLEIAIGNNQSSSILTAKASAVVNAPNNSASIKWLASTASYPTPSAVNSGGASVGGGSPFLISDLGVNLNLGDDVFVGIQCYDSFGTAGVFIQAKKTRENLSYSKTAYFTAASFSVQATVPGCTGLSRPNPDEVQYEPVGTIGALQSVVSFQLPDNATITNVAAEVFQTTIDCVVDIYFAAFAPGTSASSLPGSAYANVHSTNSTPPPGAWETQTASCSQITTGLRHMIFAVIFTQTGGGGPSIFRTFQVTYTPNSTEATV